jgi:N-methylhydantoinase A
MLWLGIDVGGTFTDLVLYDDQTRRIELLKTPSTPADQSEGILNGIRRLGIDAGKLGRLAHGSTVATNTALERNGARMNVLVTEGHRDVLIVGRGNRVEMYQIKARPLVPIVEREHCLEIKERIAADGRVLVPLDENELAIVTERLAKEGAEAVAICFLHAYANPAHEARVATRLREALPQAVIAASSEVLPEYREHERFLTTVLNAYIAPRMRNYLGALRRRLADEGYRAEVAIMTSNGGTLPATRIEALPVLSMLSGPAAGVIAASFVGSIAGFPNVITCDMGGTSTDVCLIHDGTYGMTTEGKVGAFSVKIRQIDINSVGAGGGSIAALNAGSVLSVGPRSAGAFPGPAAYGRGGTEATVTDANIVLGRLGTGERLGGEIGLDAAEAKIVVQKLAGQISLDVLATAEGIIRIAVVNMTGAIKEISVMRGVDPRDFALLAYGGAGPLHAAFIAAELGMRTVLVPPMPGNFSAFGLLVADVRRDFVRTRISATAKTTVQELRQIFAELAEMAKAELAAAGFPAERRRIELTLDIRYLGQAFELSVPVFGEVSDMSTIENAFRTVYAARYGEAVESPTEIVSYRIAAWGLTDKPQLPELDSSGRSLQAAQRTRQPVVFNGVAMETRILARNLLPLGEAFDGPVIIEELGSSTVVPPGWTVRLERHGSLILQQG